MITIEYIKECISYDQNTGITKWNIRPRNHFDSELAAKKFNNRFGGKEIVSFNTKSSGHKYKRITLFGKTQYLHRVIWFYMYGHFPKKPIRHINDNTLGNLY